MTMRGTTEVEARALLRGMAAEQVAAIIARLAYAWRWSGVETADEASHSIDAALAHWRLRVGAAPPVAADRRGRQRRT